MFEALRLYFLAIYAAGVLVIAIRSLSPANWRQAVELRAAGVRRRLPAIIVPLNWLLPPALLFTGAGSLGDYGIAADIVAIAASFYAIAMLIAGTRSLGRFLVPRAVIFEGHELVTRGPYRLVRHPVYSGVLALWLGAAIAQANLALLLLWPVDAALFHLQARQEERLLASKFGAAYERYAAATPRFLPWPRPSLK
ncbi:MAG: isoprenylcysteine carboxylmethyltransferase family protein [Planctomycetes bacterium]|nr:isoprenylcysteine carboxylmethyltransferase family protein [Planctomycetota bacterium]